MSSLHQGFLFFGRSAATTMMLTAATFAFLALTAQAAIQVPLYNQSFDSMPSLFGNKIPLDPPVYAHLQHIPGRPLLCAPSRTTTEEESYQVPIPSDGLPVALLVQRGECTFFEKSEEAILYGPHVQYVIVFDNEITPELVNMQSDSSSDMSLVFTTYHSGMELHNLMIGFANNQTVENATMPVSELFPNRTVLETGNGTTTTDFIDLSPHSGILIAVDGNIPPFALGSDDVWNVTGYLLAALAGIFAFLLVFGCVLICAHAGWITARPDHRGRLVLVVNFSGNNAGRSMDPAGTIQVMMTNGRLLTRAQVLTLPEVEYKAEENSNEENGTGTTTDTQDHPATDDNTPPNDDIDPEQGDSSSSCCCAICLEEFDNGELVRELPCHHRFHGDCIIPWLTERHSSCPLCKYNVLEHILVEPEEEEERSVRRPPRRRMRQLFGWTLVEPSASGSESNDNESDSDPPVAETVTDSNEATPAQAATVA